MRISKKIYQLLKSEDSRDDFDLGEHINNLDLLSFFKTLFFFASAWAGFPDANGKKIFKNCSSLEIHNYLNLAAIIFDNFPKNFYYFLDWTKYHNDLDKFTLKQIYRFDKKYDDRSFYGTIYKSLFEYFDHDEFHFIHESLADYMKLKNGYSSKAKFYHDSKLLRHFFIRLLHTKSTL